ncbi:hypothetical protein [Gracilibacillus xinjiangensis]|uniref:Transcriptional regulator n=1 Tax=Gracilibacillus xinjiangensis TaxID=1193282 RepID=A0ABV8WTV5_9BACI
MNEKNKRNDNLSISEWKKNKNERQDEFVIKISRMLNEVIKKN